MYYTGIYVFSYESKMTAIQWIRDVCKLDIINILKDTYPGLFKRKTTPYALITVQN